MKVAAWLLGHTIHSGDLLPVLVRRVPSNKNFISRTTGPIFSKFGIYPPLGMEMSWPFTQREGNFGVKNLFSTPVNRSEKLSIK